MQIHQCPHCKYKTPNKRDLVKHQNKRFKCNEAKYKCKKCARPFHDPTSLCTHQKDCKGRQQTTEQKDEQIQQLKNALAATNGLNAEIKTKRQQVINNIQNNNNNVKIDIDTINQVTQNIVILPTGSENIDHLKGMSMEELKEKIGLTTDPSTHVEAFKLVRLDPEHPENHNILLTEKDSDKVHWYCDKETGWQQGDYIRTVRDAIFDTNKHIQSMIPFKERENSQYYWDHLVRGIGEAINHRNDAALKPIFEGIRDPLHQATLRLMNKEPTEKSRPSSPIRQQQNIDGETMRVIERERTAREKERTRQLELQVELARLQAAKA